jgi:hypothetical protein
MTTKYSNIFLSKALQNVHTQIGYYIFGIKIGIPSGNPASDGKQGLKILPLEICISSN